MSLFSRFSLRRFFISLCFGAFVLTGAVSHSWYVCLSSYQSAENAFSEQKKLAQKNIPVLVTMHYLNEKKVFRLVYEKEFETSSDARNFKYDLEEELSGKIDVSGLWVCRAFDFLEEEVSLPAAAATGKTAEAVKETEPVQAVSSDSETAPAAESAAEVSPAPQISLKSERGRENDAENTAGSSPENARLSFPENSTETPEESSEETGPEVPAAPIVLTKNVTNSEQISEEKPYSVKIRSYKEEQNAVKDQQRLKEQDIDSYILKTYDDITLFGFDLYSGAFKTEEETEAVQEKLEDMGITDTEVAQYSQVEEKVQAYNQVIEKQEVTYEDGQTHLPSVFSGHIKNVVQQFPVNSDFSIEKVLIADFDNIRRSSLSLDDGGLKELSEELMSTFELPAENLHAASFVNYRDDLYDREIEVFMAESDEGSFAALDLSDKINYQFQLAKGTANCIIVYSDGENRLYGTNNSADLFICMKTEDFTEEDFKKFLSDCRNSSGLLIYPQLRKTLAVLPEKVEEEKPLKFFRFDFDQVDESYAVSKHFTDWSKAIVGHWEACGRFENGKITSSIAFYDMDYDYNASKVHGMFMDYRQDGLNVSSYNHPVEYKNGTGWYLDKFDGNELSFSTSSYIIAINSDSSDEMPERYLKNLADRLKIWK